MKKSMFLLAVLPLILMSPPSKAGDQIKVDPFHSIQVSSDIVAELVFAENEAVQADFEGAPEEKLILEVVDSVLKIRMQTGKYKDANLKVKVFYNKDLQQLEAGARAQIWSEEDLNFENQLSLKIFNGGEMRFVLCCDSLSATITQGSILHLSGMSNSMNIKVNTGATFSGYEFETVNADVSASGGGKAKVSVSGNLKAIASTKGFIGYVGKPGKVYRKATMMGEILETTLEQ